MVSVSDYYVLIIIRIGTGTIRTRTDFVKIGTMGRSIPGSPWQQQLFKSLWNCFETKVMVTRSSWCKQFRKRPRMVSGKPVSVNNNKS